MAQASISLSAFCSCLSAKFKFVFARHTAASSAYYDNETGSFSSDSCKVLMITLKRIGLSTLPGGHPFSSFRGSDVSTPTLTCIFLSVRKLWIHLSMLSVIPNSRSLSIVPVVHIRSKAFSRSRKVATTILFSMKAIFMVDSSLVS